MTAGARDDSGDEASEGKRDDGHGYELHLSRHDTKAKTKGVILPKLTFFLLPAASTNPQSYLLYSSVLL